MLVLFGLMNVFIITFFASFTIISSGYLTGFLIKRRRSRTKPVTGNRWAMSPTQAPGFESLAKSMGN
jgi:hypothetical protein